MMSQQEKQAFQKKIFNWWEKNRRDLPWRHINDPYKILVSEMMLQQTQVSRVLARYVEFIEAYPTVNDLAKASPGDILRLWKGMGYNRRALYLQKAARAIVNIYKGKLPSVEQELTKLPGLGKYTARAILVFAFRKDIAMVDTNIRQILTHFFFHDKPQPEKNIQETADQLVPKGKSWEWHQALMDYGALELHNNPINKSTNNPIKQIPFKESNRYFRGRIMDLLREKSYIKKELLKVLYLKYGKDEAFYTGLLKGLEKDGLVIQKNSIWSLPTI